MNNLYYRLLKESQREKLSINKKTLLKVKKLYEEESKKLISKLNNANEMNSQYINSYLEYVNKELKSLSKQIEKLTKQGIADTSQLMTEVNADVFSYIVKKYNLDIEPDILESLYKPNSNVINKIISGNLYKDNKSLSKRIWGYNRNNLNKIQEILIDGMVNKRPLQDITNTLSAYTGGGNTKVKAITSAYGQMNANSLRLVRTSLNHAFIETMKDETKKNPFIEGYKWIMSGAHSSRMPNGDICDDYSSHDEGIGIGVFKKNNIPIPHPNCMCVIIPYSEKPLETIGEEIGKWIKGEPNKEIDAWVKGRGYEKTIPKTTKSKTTEITKSKTTKSTKRNNISWHKYSYDDKTYENKKEMIKHLKDKGITFNDARGDKGITPKFLNGIVNWIDKFEGCFAGFKENNPIAMPPINIKTDKNYESIGSFEAYVKRKEAIELALNSKYYSSEKTMNNNVKAAVRANWTVANATYNKTFVHEYGHYISYSMSWIEYDNGGEIWTRNFMDSVIKDYNEKYNQSAEFKDVPKLLSKYGGSSYEEAFAEAFAEYFGGEKPREFAQVFGEKLEKKLKKLGKQKGGK